MFEFTGKLKTISIILMVIGVISVGVSFFMGGGDHHEGGEHTEQAAHGEHATEGHGEAAHGEHHEAPAHHADAGHHGNAMPDTDDYTYHKTASRAIPENNHFHASPTHHDAEHIHHQIENKPWANLLTNNFFFLSIALGALFFMAVQYAAQAGWTVVLLRVMEAMTSFLWIPMVIMLIIIGAGVMHMGGNHIWHWMAEGIMDPASDNYDSIIAGKEGYLNGPFFIIRTLIYFIGWVGGAMLIRKMSMKMENNPSEAGAIWKKTRNLSAGFLVFFAVTSSTSAWDWIMSIDTHWFSTLFGWYIFAGMFVTALTVLTLIVIYLKSKGYLPEVNKSHIQDMGKFMFAFSIFWTYLWFSQYMLIWYSNIPEEVTYYMARFGEYKGIFFTMVAFNLLFPILILMSRDSKRNFGFLLTAGIFMIIGHWLDVYILIHPGSVGGQWSIGLVNFGTFLGFAGLFIYVVFSALTKAPLMPKNHPMYVESEHHHI
ncbi:quinol:cytochrome C oxidoreductase [Owenweeksia hongkongensis]|uniref:quinol:cytochrome C oxidoreductase n=1 Tax=Owenweeksia hongkongensis TaxID=253245 RepID=UPI003A8CD2C0